MYDEELPRSYVAISATGQPKYHKGFLPLVPGFSHVPYNDLEAMSKVVNEQTCAILVEPIQGEGGIIEPSPGYLAGLRELCDKHGALLIFDEVQTGVARTGHWFAHQFDGVTPDIMSLAKGLGGGVPIGAMLCTETVAEGFQPGVHASTYGGNPLVCAASLAVINTIENDGLMADVARVGMPWRRAFRPCRTVRCMPKCSRQGLMRGMGVDPDRFDRAAVMAAARERGLLITTAGADAFRLVPPLIVDETHVEEAMSILRASIESVIG